MRFKKELSVRKEIGKLVFYTVLTAISSVIGESWLNRVKPASAVWS